MHEDCERLNCRQSMLLDLLVDAQARHQAVKQSDVFLYDSEKRRLDVSDYEDWSNNK